MLYVDGPAGQVVTMKPQLSQLLFPEASGSSQRTDVPRPAAQGPAPREPGRVSTVLSGAGTSSLQSFLSRGYPSSARTPQT